MSVVDDAEKMTGSQQKEKVSIKDIDPAYGSKDSKDLALERIEDCMNQIKSDIRDILRLLRDKEEE